MGDGTEHALNRRLRRADWRFLLPTPRPRRAMCRAGAALTDAVTSIAGEVVPVGSGNDCDLVVAENPDRATLAELREALHPEGACYTEWRLRLGGRARVERELRAAGFVDIRCYRPWPTERPVYWVPLGAGGAAGYVRSRRLLRGGRLRRLLASLLRRPLGVLRSDAASPICAVARRAERSTETDPAAWLRARWPEWGEAPPERLSILLVTGGPRSVSKVVLLAFAEPSPVPRMAVKAPRVDAAAEGVRREGDALASLALRDGGGVRGVPRVLFRRELDGVPVVGETALTGRPLEGLLSPRSLRAWSTTVADWLAALPPGSPRPAAHWRHTIADPALSRFFEEFGGVADRGLLRESERLVHTLGALRPVPEQRDFGPWNLLITARDELAVLDWESAEIEGLPALDLLYYLAYASFHVDRAHDVAGRVASYRRSLDPSSRTGAVRRACIARYCGAVGLDPAQLAPLRALLWMIHAPSDFRHAVADRGGAPSPDALARSLFLALWAEELRDLTRG
jgi:hypothetical protein